MRNKTGERQAEYSAARKQGPGLLLVGCRLWLDKRDDQTGTVPVPPTSGFRNIALGGASATIQLHNDLESSCPERVASDAAPSAHRNAAILQGK